MKPQRRSLGAAFGDAFAGFAAAWGSQRNLRIHAGLALAAVVAGVILRPPLLGWALGAFAVALVIVTELLNTALESLVDLISPDEHPLAKRAKDVAAAAVLIASLGALVVGVLIVLDALDLR